MGVGVGKNVNTVIPIDRAEFSASVTREPCMTGGIDVAGTHALTGLESRGHLHIALAWMRLGSAAGILSGVSGGVALAVPGCRHAALNLRSA